MYRLAQHVLWLVGLIDYIGDGLIYSYRRASMGWRAAAFEAG